MEIEISGYKVLIDDEDWEKVHKYKWCIDKRSAIRGFNYVQTKINIDGKNIWWSMHRMIMNCLPRDTRWVDHINHDTQDNRKCNLRFATRAENAHNMKKHTDNKSGYKGVVYRKGFYRAYIISNGKFYQVKSSKDIIECARWYDMAALFFDRNFSYTNFPRESYTDTAIEEAGRVILDYRYANNSSGFRGVSYKKHKGTWVAYINKNNIRTYLGDFLDIIEAAKARDKKAIELYGDKAILNFPKETYIKELQNGQEAED